LAFAISAAVLESLESQTAFTHRSKKGQIKSYRIIDGRFAALFEHEHEHEHEHEYRSLLKLLIRRTMPVETTARE
jgi:hypothetical protein